jgi:AcrR family transcriptional regulator
MPRKIKSTKAGQSRATTKKLIAAATQEFSLRGYANASTETIVRHAGVTRGALYHHFKDKKNLFFAVFEEAQRAIARRIEARVDDVDDPWRQLVIGCRAFLQACSEPGLQQIVVIDAPAVLDWNAYREVDETLPGSGFSLLKQGLQELIDRNIIKPLSVDAAAHLLSGAMDEAAVWIARCDDLERALAEAQRALESLLDGLLA